MDVTARCALRAMGNRRQSRRIESAAAAMIERERFYVKVTAKGTVPARAGDGPLKESSILPVRNGFYLFTFRVPQVYDLKNTPDHPEQSSQFSHRFDGTHEFFNPGVHGVIGGCRLSKIG